MPRVTNAQNLVPLNKRSKEAQREIQSKGGKVCAEKRREKIILSQIYADFLCESFDIQFQEEERKKLGGVQFVKEVQKRILSRCDSSSVSMLKEIREATEGSKNITELTGQVTIIDDIR
jgi:hypothetical protein